MHRRTSYIIYLSRSNSPASPAESCDPTVHTTTLYKISILTPSEQSEVLVTSVVFSS